MGYPASETDKGYDTYWFDQLIQKKLSYFQGLSFSKSQKNSSVRFSAGIKNHQGLAIDTYNKTTNFRLNINQSIFDRVELNAILSGSRSNQKFTNYDAFNQALQYDPTAPVYNADGTYYELSGVGASNPLALIKQIDNTGITSRFNGSLAANIEIIKDLKITLSGSSSIKNIDNSVFEDTDSRNSQISGVKGNASKYAEFSIENVFEFLTNYSYKIGSHDTKFMGGYSYIENEKSSSYMSNSNFLTNSFGADNIAAGSFLKDGKATMESTREKSTLIAFFGRMNYSYKSKYMFNASIRREGASVFGENNKWGWFPALSAGWRMSEEDFLKHINFINQLKLRAGYGVTGRSQGIPLYQSLSRIGYSGNAFFNGQWIGSYGPTANANPNLRWEKTKEFNVGIDYTIFKDLITGSLDVYNRLTIDLLGNYVTQTPPSIEPNIFANVGTVKNKGIEVGVSIKAIQKEKFGLNLSLSYSQNINKVISLSNDQFKADSILYGDYGNVSSSLYILAKGLPIGTFYGFKAKGIDTNGKWVFEDQNGDGKIEETVDFTVLGNGLPKHLYSFTANFTYDKFYLNIYFVGAAGFDVFNAKRLWYENTTNSPSNYFTSILKSPNSELDDRLRFSDYYLEKGDYLRLDNVTLGYNFEKTKHFKLIGIYVTATNILNITGYSGFDPEVGSGTGDGLTPGWDQQSFYPRSSTYQIGLNVNF
jgi:TonB-linked SusC/RagA family outer membrane protein